jgi:hypothetical protein
LVLSLPRFGVQLLGLNGHFAAHPVPIVAHLRRLRRGARSHEMTSGSSRANTGLPVDSRVLTVFVFLSRGAVLNIRRGISLDSIEFEDRKRIEIFEPLL